MLLGDDPHRPHNLGGLIDRAGSLRFRFGSGFSHPRSERFFLGFDPCCKLVEVGTGSFLLRPVSTEEDRYLPEFAFVDFGRSHYPSEGSVKPCVLFEAELVEDRRGLEV